MTGLRLCCNGVEDEPKGKIIVLNKTESFYKAKNATVIPPKRVCVKKLMCSCFIHRFCDKCLNTKTSTKTKAVYGSGN